MNHMDRDLYLALVDDNIDVLRGKDWLEISNQLTPANNTVLHLTCQYGSIRCVEEILLHANESLLFQINSKGETALHLAARQGHYDTVVAVINKAKSLDPEPNNLENTSSTVLQNLIRAPNRESETALHAAVRYNHENVVQLLVEEDPSYSYPQNKYDETPLYLAAVRCYVGVTKVILDNCVSPTFSGPHGRTALHAALMTTTSAGYECMELLLGKNKDLIKVADSNGWTSFHYVASNNWFTVLEFLLSVDKSVAYLTDKIHKRTALHVAAYKGYHDVIRTLLKNLPDAWESVDKYGQNILHIALKHDQKSVIKFILSGKQKFDAKNTLFIQRDNEGNTPLHLIAKFECYFPELQKIHNWNVDWDVADATNFTPRDVFHEKQFGTLINEVPMEALLDRTHVQDHWEKWIKDKEPVGANKRVEEVRRAKRDEEVRRAKRDELTIKRYKEVANTHMIVAALITTVALTAGFAMPGGFDGNQGPNQGSPVLLRKTAFRTFLVADTIALLFSISSLFIYFLIPMKRKANVIDNLVAVAAGFNVVSITAMMLAFIAGTSSVLSHSSGLTISVCIISSLFIFLVFYVCFRFFRDQWRGFIYGSVPPT